MTFKARILNIIATAEQKEMLQGVNIKEYVFDFSKTKIFFTKNQKDKSFFISGCMDGGFKNGTKYVFEKVYDDNDKKKFQITLHNIQICKSYLELGIWDTIKCNIIHKRYWVQKEPVASITLIVSIMTLIVTIVAVVLKK